MINYDYLRVSLHRLEEQYRNYGQLDPSWPASIREAIAESVVVRFKRCYDCAWRVTKRYLAEVQGIPDLPNAPKPLLRCAFASNVLDGSSERWLKYAEWRVAVADDYCPAKVEEYVRVAGDFIADAVLLFENVTGQSWKDAG